MDKMKNPAGKGLTKSKAWRQSKNRPYYAKQFFITKAHKEIAWTKHLNNHPNDLQAKNNIAKTKAL